MLYLIQPNTTYCGSSRFVKRYFFGGPICGKICCGLPAVIFEHTRKQEICGCKGYGIHRNKCIESDTKEIYDTKQGGAGDGGVRARNRWGKVMVKNAMRFSAEEYRKGIRGLEEISEDTLFCQLFSEWKSIVPMDSDVRERAIKRITVLLEKRTEGIMDANRRNYYGECAAYIAALGEVRESMGEAGAKQRLMTSYKGKYPRRSAFREEMRSNKKN